jgi:hypothetical protein
LLGRALRHEWKLPKGVKIGTKGSVHDEWYFHEYLPFRAVCQFVWELNLMGMNNALLSMPASPPNPQGPTLRRARAAVQPLGPM